MGTIDTTLSTEQALHRYNLLAKSPKMDEDNSLAEFISESSELVASLKTGEPVEQLELEYFLDDIATFWENLEMAG
ncbi:hypothetical protein HMPREF2991_02910 [Streptococcus sp. HMSC072D07]|jgi:hypothetical protein|uniref:hypothetical protein n=1 Tax=Streptococcus sp. HMSC072D07 TaxID=1739495 RepID=UPI0008A26CB9|nr:hypothetical protein [Streptococcus sp. HMSC072D07]OFP34793.1 hypothetical protein HMPREF2991_02910 [Streptococcus sp. HMSC072D07]